jgi:release factor glutamine methyltransferase
MVDASATIGTAVADARRRLTDAGVGEAALDARLLVQHVLNIDAAMIVGHPERQLDADERKRLADLVTRRCRREPLAYIVGMHEFWSLPLAVNAATLVPRPASETVVEAALDWVTDQAIDRAAPLTLLDLGTGSGCLLLALLSELPGARGVGVDISPAAIDVARANATALGLDDRVGFVVADWAAGLGGRFDIIVANPPYVPTDDRETLAPEIVSYEPEGAVFAGADGLDAYRETIPHLDRLLASGGAAFLEIGAGQDQSVVELAEDQGLQVLGITKDLSGIPRCVAIAPQAQTRD